MKITYWSPYIGHVGTIKAVLNSALSMSEYGKYKVDLIKNHSEWEGYEGKLESGGVRLVDFCLKRWVPGLNRMKFAGSRIYMLVVAFLGFFQLLIYFRKNKPDVLITNLIAVPAILAARISRGKKICVITSIQGFPKFLGDIDNYPLWMRVEDRIRRWLWERVYPKADLLVSMTEATKEKLTCSAGLPKEKIVVINNPVIDEDIYRLSREEVNDPWLFSEGYKSIISVGRLTKQKDYLTLIKAMDLLKEKKYRLAILGEGEERENLSGEIIRRGLQGKVRLYGFVSNPFNYISNSDLFVLSSLWEDPGHAILEAAALKIPILSTDCPSGPSDLLEKGKGGELCDVGDYKCMAYKINKILVSPGDAIKKTEVAYKNVYKYSKEAHYRKLDSYIRTLVREGRG